MADQIRGLDEPLPDGERLLWQGAPRWQSLFVHAFHGRKLAVYFGALLLLRAAFAVADGASLGGALIAAAWLLPLAGVALGVVALLAWLSARTTIYAITDRRIVMRIGIVLTLTLNVPFRQVEAASVRGYADGTGDLPFEYGGDTYVAWLHLWPHVRPWRIARVQPMLRAVADAPRVAELLSRALAEHAGTPVRAAPQPADTPAAVHPAELAGAAH
jgi:hypothetical protein